ncbi:hypothetical protein BH23THE1_BH23THE1_09030 [soil metagenome]
MKKCEKIAKYVVYMALPKIVFAFNTEAVIGETTFNCTNLANNPNNMRAQVRWR